MGKERLRDEKWYDVRGAHGTRLSGGPTARSGSAERKKRKGGRCERRETRVGSCYENGEIKKGMEK